MNFLIIHNKYSLIGGEESVVRFQKNLLESYGHKVVIYYRDYQEINNMFLGKIRSMFLSIYNSRSKKDINKILSSQKIDICLVHNLYPLVSNSIFHLLNTKHIPILQIVHNYRLFCPNGKFFTKGRICEKCAYSTLKTINCAINNCNENLFSSICFAIKFGFINIINNNKRIDKYLCLSHFAKNKLIQYGLSEKKIFVLPNAYMPTKDFALEDIVCKDKTYIAFVGRFTIEKGFYDFLSLARLMPKYQFKIAGLKTKEIENIDIPANVEFCGFLQGEQLADFYIKAKIMVFPSTWYEGLPMVIIESLYYGTPLIVNKLSVMQEIVSNNITGYVVPLLEGKTDILTYQKKIETIFNDEKQYLFMSKQAKIASQNYTSQKYYNNLINIINQ